MSPGSNRQSLGRLLFLFGHASGVKEAVLMTDKHPQQATQTNKNVTEPRTKQEQTYLDHGAESLVAMDNPDDSQLGAPEGQGKGSAQ
jgi:hypothetical protein